MPMPQSIQQIPSLAKKLYHRPHISCMAIGGMILIETIGLIAGPIFGLFLGATALIGAAIYLKKRNVTRIVAATLTVMLVAISAGAIFPSYGTILQGTALGALGLCTLYLSYKIVKKNCPKSKL